MTTHEAGRELDAEIAEKVMGWMWMPYTTGGGRPCSVLMPPGTPTLTNLPTLFEQWSGPTTEEESRVRPHIPRVGTTPKMPHYSTNIAAAWEVLGYLHGRTERWEVFDAVLRETVLPAMHATALHELVPDRAALAICRAALAAVEATA